MGPDSTFERHLQVLLDGRPLEDDAAGSDESSPGLRLVDVIGRIHRRALFGSDVSPDVTVTRRWGYLEIRDEIGRGASGTVYRAWDTRLAREVALKLWSADASHDAALAEGRLLARLNHPHIVRVFGADVHDGVAGIWMELLEGETLEQVLSRDGVFAPEEALLVGIDLARAVSAVHSAGLLHRDVKARNVLRERGGRIVLMDLGAGRTVHDAPAGINETGTPMYMAPELLGGESATVRSDLYGLGVVLYRLLTGRFPVTASDLEGLRSAHAARAAVPLAMVRPDLSRDIVAAVERSSDPDPTRRPASALELETALTEALRATIAGGAAIASPMTRSWIRWRKHILVTTAAIVSIVVIVGWLWDTTTGRTARRLAGMSVPPRSTLYLTLSGALGILRGRELTVRANPTSAVPIVVASDLGVRTAAGLPPWTTGGNFRLDGTPLPSLKVVNEDFCCFHDGATDGRFNYSVRQDSTQLEPPGSRPLAPPGLYQFERDWSNPQLLFPVAAEGGYFGIAYSAASQSFWLTRKAGTGSVIEQWSRDGRHLATPARIPAATLYGLAVDPLDDTLWTVRQQYGSSLLRLENFDATGRHLGSLEVERPRPLSEAIGAEFAWIHSR